MTAYVALQTLAGWRSLQTCDFGANELRGSLNDSFTVYICDHSGKTECAGKATSPVVPGWRILLLDKNRLTGEGAGSRHITCRRGVVVRVRYFQL